MDINLNSLSLWEDLAPIETPPPSKVASLIEKNGVIYTKRWVVDLVLDLAGYRSDKDLTRAFAVEPAAGDGAFLLRMAQRLVQSCRKSGHSIAECERSLIAYEIDPKGADTARSTLALGLLDLGLSTVDADRLAEAWIQVGDYLRQASRLPSADFVMGNPPYIRLENMDGGGADYRALFPTMKGRADLYIGFFEAGLRQLSPGGVCAYICADRWMLNQYGAELRGLIASRFAVETVLEMHRADPFQSNVSAYPAITIIRREHQGPVVVATVDADAEHTEPGNLSSTIEAVRSGERATASLCGITASRSPGWFKGKEPWSFGSVERFNLLRRLEDSFEPLENPRTGTRVGIGIATGADGVFITTDPERVESSRLVRLAMANDCLSGRIEWSGHYLVNPWGPSGLVDLADFPRLKDYFQANEARLRKRNIGQKSPRNWYRTIDRLDAGLVPKSKLYIPDIKNVIHPVLDRGETYPHHNVYFVRSDVWDLEVLGGLLLSAVAEFFVECYGVRMRGGYLRFQAQYLRRIRLPLPESLTEVQAARLRQSFKDRSRRNATEVALEVYGIECELMGGLIGH